MQIYLKCLKCPHCCELNLIYHIIFMIVKFKNSFGIWSLIIFIIVLTKKNVKKRCNNKQ